MPDARCTRGLVCKNVQRSAHEHTGSAEAIRHSLRNGLTAYAVLSPASEFVLSPSLADQGLAEPGRAGKTSASLAPATGVGTTRFCRTQLAPFVLRAARSLTNYFALRFHWRADAAASTTSHPAFRDDHDTPLLPGKDGANW